MKARAHWFETRRPKPTACGSRRHRRGTEQRARKQGKREKRMAQTTIEQFATELKMPPGALLEQLAAAGVAGKKQGDKLTEQDKTRLLDYLRKQHGAAASRRSASR